MKVNSAQFQRNGVSGRPFFAGIVTDPFGEGRAADYLVVSLDGSDGETPSPQETFVIAMDDLNAGHLASGWRGDMIRPETLQAIRTTVEAKRVYERAVA